MNSTARLAVSMLALTALGGCYIQTGAAARPYHQGGYGQEGYVVDEEGVVRRALELTDYEAARSDLKVAQYRPS
jgi:hypothetical protein